MGIEFTANDRVLILGSTGFIGKRLAPALADKNIKLRLLVRDPARISSLPQKYPDSDIEIVKGDIVSNRGISDALKDIHTAYYLIHSMGGKSLTKNRKFTQMDKQAAYNFVKAVETEGVRRVIYLGGLGEKGKDLSDHLRSRAEVGHILASSKKVSATVLRAAIIIGAGGASFEMLRYLVERLPIMICPKWINTRIQPIAVGDVISYLTGCLLNQDTAGQKFDICGPDILTYRDMMQQYAEVRNLGKRWIINVPVLTPQLSAYWVDLVTPVPSGVAHPLIDGLKSEVICMNDRIREFISLKLTTYKEAVRIAFSEETEGPGITGF